MYLAPFPGQRSLPFAWRSVAAVMLTLSALEHPAADQAIAPDELVPERCPDMQADQSD